LQNRPRLRYPERFLAVFAVVSFVAVATGCLVVAINDTSAGAWLLNLTAWGVGAVMALAVSRSASPLFVRIMAFAAPFGLLASLANPGEAGVHRWIDVGPVHANVAALLLPAFVVALAAVVRDGSLIWLACAACAVLLVLQPDASQATAFAAAVLIVVVRLPTTRAIRVSMMVLVSSGAVIAWLRPDPLAPVAEVEGIVGLAYAISPPVAIVAVVALGGAALAPMMTATRPGRSAARTAALALSAYFVFSALTPLFGAFPVPLVGTGVSPVIGFWMGAGLLVAIASRGSRKRWPGGARRSPARSSGCG
jgi:cell division protein FtsW (lipid II flippase)